MANIKFGPLYSRIHELVGVKEFADTTVQMGFDAIWVPDTVSHPPSTPWIGLAGGRGLHRAH